VAATVGTYGFAFRGDRVRSGAGAGALGLNFYTSHRTSSYLEISGNGAIARGKPPLDASLNNGITVSVGWRLRL
jgi:hypothetical protein